MSRLHDNQLLSYTVDFTAKTILLHTEYWYENRNEKTKVRFTNVTAHFFRDAGSMDTILFDIDSYEVEQFIKEYGGLLQERKQYGWPFLYTSRTELIEKLRAQKQKYFCLQSSCGMEGFILAEDMQLDSEVPAKQA